MRHFARVFLALVVLTAAAPSISAAAQGADGEVASFDVVSITTEKQSIWWPRSASIVIVVRNTGGAAIHPTVAVSGGPVKGPTSVSPASQATYVADVSLPWYGGPTRVFVDVAAEGGAVRRASTSILVVPWGLLLVVVAAFVALGLVSRLWRRRYGRLNALRRDIRRLEQLIIERTTTPSGVTAPEESADDVDVAALLVGMKRARRAGEWDAFGRLALRLHEVTRDAETELREASRRAGPDVQAEVSLALTQYPPPVSEAPAPAPPTLEAEPEPPPSPRRRRPPKVT